MIGVTVKGESPTTVRALAEAFFHAQRENIFLSEDVRARMRQISDELQKDAAALEVKK